MVTFVGTQSSFEDALKELIELDYDAIEAYEAAINRLKNPVYQKKLTEFKADHQRHVRELSDLLTAHSIIPPSGPSTKQWLTQGKVVIEQVIGDDGILSAMSSNENDTNRAYETMHDRTDKWQDAVEVIKRGLADERKHKAWLSAYMDTFQILDG